ncbi:hypothetical protein HAZT_HAZT001373 [Hyalella azteca]|uniref:transketolase n=1 Tax=Hyalella azteca TaxID=294128 RepID=A0A6A0H6D4_HYAAZ|nr:hypothetical protein HAZT_HAZT001373 [Hyalella azteca]
MTVIIVSEGEFPERLLLHQLLDAGVLGGCPTCHQEWANWTVGSGGVLCVLVAILLTLAIRKKAYCSLIRAFVGITILVAVGYIVTASILVSENAGWSIFLYCISVWLFIMTGIVAKYGQLMTNINCVGSHAGISIGEDGPSQMALEDIAMFRAIPTATVFYPSDAVSTERAIELAANTKGICFVRTSRPATSVVYPNDKKFAVGKANIILQSADDVALVIGAGITLEEARKAAEILAQKGSPVRIMDPFTIKPLDEDAVREHAKQCGGGLGDAVKSAVSGERDIVVKHLAVRAVPRSGKCDELLEMFGINAASIVQAVEEVMLV